MDQSLPLPTDAPRMAPLRRLPVAAVTHLALMGALAWSWLVISGAGPGVFEAVVCAAPALLAFGGDHRLLGMLRSRRCARHST